MFFMWSWLFLVTVQLALFARCHAEIIRNGDDTIDRDEDISDQSSQPHYGSDDTIKNRIHFRVYTKQNPTGREIKIHSKYLITSIFDPSLPTVFVTHGWGHGPDRQACTSIRNGYLAGPLDVNVIVVDWSYYTKKWYFPAIAGIKAVGNEITYLIHRLKSLGLIEPISTTLVGHSLGAHLMGDVGRNMGGAIGIIFGLDPAKPFFSGKRKQLKISKDCARHVQIIHTNGNQLGIYKACGHSDFYPNGGQTQKGCTMTDKAKIGQCSHDRAWKYFAESLHSPLRFKARRCENGETPSRKDCTGPIAFMGGYLNNTDLHGVYYLQTHDSSPYAMM